MKTSLQMVCRLFLYFSLFLLCPSLSHAFNTYHVRTDGGTAAQCTGLADAPYTPSVTNRACAFNHPFYPLGYSLGNQALMAGGDTLIIHKGSYKMGYDSNGKFPNCTPNNTYECIMRSVPSGTATNHTKILGEGYNTGCANPPELWGTEKAYSVLALNGSNYVDVQCLEITDHSSCRAGGPPINKCNSSFPFGPWAQTGVNSTDSSNVTLTDVNVHGLGYHGLYTGRLKDWTLTRVKVNGHGQAGWHGETVYGNSSNSGNIIIRNSEFKWNGCAENYPQKTSPVIGSCCSQSQGCYNDGIGMGSTGGNWLIENSNVSFNAEDGIDLLYVHLNQPTNITIRRTIAQGNAGNNIKTGATNVNMEHVISVSGCRFLQNAGYTAPGWGPGDNTCRAGGEPLAMDIDAGTHHKITNSTFIQTELDKNSSILGKGSTRPCDGTEDIKFVNNIWYGGNYLQYDDISTCAGFTSDDIKNTYSNIYLVRSGCPVGAGNICTDPKLLGFPLPLYKLGATVKLTSTSPGRNKATEAITFTDSSKDFYNNSRGSTYDMGAIEYGSNPQ